MDTYRELVDDLIGDGYHEGSPGALAEEIDRPAAERYPCPDCGGPMVYRPWLRPGDVRTHYRAFAVCERCDSYSKF